MYNTSSSSVITPPSGWITLINGTSTSSGPGMGIFSRVKESGDTTFDFTRATAAFSAIMRIWSNDATTASVGIGLPAAFNNINTNRTIPSITLTSPSLVLGIIHTSAPTADLTAPATVEIISPTGFVLDEAKTEPTGSNYRNINRYSKQYATGETDPIIFRVTDSEGGGLSTSGIQLALTV